jgi:hypothetical protein
MTWFKFLELINIWSRCGEARADGSLKPVAFLLQGEVVPASDWWDKLGKLEAALRLILPSVLFGLVVTVEFVLRSSRLWGKRNGWQRDRGLHGGVRLLVT